MMGETRDGLVEAVDKYLKMYNTLYGPVKMRILGAQFGRRVRKVAQCDVRTFLSESDRFLLIPNKNGGFHVWSRSLPFEGVANMGAEVAPNVAQYKDMKSHVRGVVLSVLGDGKGHVEADLVAPLKGSRYSRMDFRDILMDMKLEGLVDIQQVDGIPLWSLVVK
jgi:hypothetical protein